MDSPTKKRGQGAFEYILLLAGILLIVVLVIVILKGGLLTETQTNVQKSTGISQANARTHCLDWCGDGAWKYLNSSASGYDTNCNDSSLLGSSPNSNCFWNGTETSYCNATKIAGSSAAGTPPQNARACGLFSTDMPAS